MTLIVVALLLAGCMSPPAMTLEQYDRQRERACTERSGTWDGRTCR